MKGAAGLLLAVGILLIPFDDSAAFAPASLNSVVSLLPHWPGHPRAGALDLPPGVAPEASAVAIAPGGYLVTAYHAVAPADALDVRLRDGRIQAAEMLAFDPLTDIALLKIEADLPVPAQVETSSLGLADPVCAVGNAFGLGLSVTCGVVSALARTSTGFNAIEDFIQTDAAVNPGMSGGGLFDGQGNLVGMLSAIFASEVDTNAGVNFAVSAELLQRVAFDLQEYGAVRRGDSGLRVRDPSREDLRKGPGALVIHVREGSPAAEAGLQAGDLLIEAAGRSIASAADFRTALQLQRPGERFDLIFRRGESRVTTKLTLEWRSSGE